MLCLKIQLLSDNGGDGLTNYVKRNMKYLLSPRVAREFNLTGQRGKRAFQTLHLNQVLFGKYLLLFCFYASAIANWQLDALYFRPIPSSFAKLVNIIF